ncbi:hypothetical protein LCGC14_2416080, partial [marine sediment metagenome]
MQERAPLTTAAIYVSMPFRWCWQTTGSIWRLSSTALSLWILFAVFRVLVPGRNWLLAACAVVATALGWHKVPTGRLR